jgi:DNA polymerase III alpha subunit
LILSVNGYSFRKAHSASCASLAIRLAYLKCHYPRLFFGSVIDHGGGYYSRQTYVHALRRTGCAVLPPDVNRSELVSRLEESGLRLGLRSLRRVSGDFLARLLAERRRAGPFRSREDLLRRVAPRPRELDVLVRSGALDALGESCGSVPAATPAGTSADQPELFLPEELGTGPGRSTTCAAARTASAVERRLLDELQSLGMAVSRHPLELMRPHLSAAMRGSSSVVDSRGLAGRGGNAVCIAGMPVGGKEAMCRERQPMVFVSFEDEFGVFETVFVPHLYRRYRDLLGRAAVLILRGAVEERWGAVSLRVEKAWGPFAAEERERRDSGKPLIRL